MTHRERVVDYWDAHVKAWMSGADAIPEPLVRWFTSYAGTGRGEVTREGFVEPYQGDLLGSTHEPRLVVLGLNPGMYKPELQARDAVFAREMTSDYRSSYHDWVVSSPYLRDPWVAMFGRNRYFADRVTFTGRWLQIDDVVPNDMMVFELFPWHSTGVTGQMRPPADIIDRFVWAPISEIDCSDVFAFGREWDATATSLGLECVQTLGAGGDDYGSTVASRTVRVYTLPSRQRLVIEWHSGSAGPPSAAETELLRSALIRSAP